MTYLVEAYMGSGPLEARLRIARVKRLSFVEGRRTADKFVMDHGGWRMGPITALVTENRTGRLRYRVES